jgi:hypothetical protein
VIPGHILFADGLTDVELVDSDAVYFVAILQEDRDALQLCVEDLEADVRVHFSLNLEPSLNPLPWKNRSLNGAFW